MDASQESEFEQLAGTYLEHLFETLEEQDEGGILDIDYEAGSLTITLKNGKTFLVSKHAPTRQLWLSSPISGGLHFMPADGGKDWKLKDGRRLSIVLAEELRHLTGAAFELQE
ncbi:MAG: iron donor protein CyaY [Rickettsiales bacterium]